MTDLRRKEEGIALVSITIGSIVLAMSNKLRSLYKYIALRKKRLFVIGAVALSVLGIIDKLYFHSVLLTLLWGVGIFLWVIFAASLMTVAAFAIMKPLIQVSAGFTLLIFLSQTYCGLDSVTDIGKKALLIVLLFGFIYLAYGFFTALRKPVADITQAVRDDPVWEGYMSIVLLFIMGGVFIWALSTVVVPVVQSICAFH